MARMRFVLDRAGVRSLLKSDAFRSAVTDKAEAVAQAARAGGMDVFVDGGTTDRAVAAVVVADTGAAAEQAKTGFLTRAATAQGLDVRATP